MNNEPGRFLLARTGMEEETPQYILHTRTPRALLQLVSVSNPEKSDCKVYSYLAQNEVEPRHFTFKVVQSYEPCADCTAILDDAWQWLYANDVLAA